MTYTLESDGKVLEATPEQAEIIDFALANPMRHILINALAGAAKTSTLRFLAKYLPPDPTLSLAFNKRIADEMGKLLPGNVRCATMNSVGHRVWASATGKKLTLETKKTYNLVQIAINELPARQRAAAWDIFSDITKAVSRAKLSGYVPSSVTGAKSLYTAQEFFGTLEEEPDDWFCQIVNTVLTKGIVQAYAGLIDFDDQIYMPILFGGSFPQHKRVLGDEAQDFNRLNHEMFYKLVGPNTQLIAVGDPWQSIYAFRGAVTNSMSQLKERFDMHEMTLSVSFRCPIKVVENAHWRVPHMKWPSWAIAGEVAELPEWGPDAIPDNSAIICRNNAPLLKCALALLRSRRGVHLVGTDLGPQLVRALKKLGGPGKFPNLQMSQHEVFNAIDLWETEKLAKARDSGTVTDKAECLRVFAGFGKTLGEAITYCEVLFKAQGPIQLLSGHKAKGLEWDTVYHLDPHRIPSPWSKEGEPLEQEKNVRYVIETRAKKALYFVRMDTFIGADP